MSSILWLLTLVMVLALKAGPAFMAQPPENDGPKPIPVLTYHAITEDPAVAAANDLYITTATFERQIVQILVYGYTPIFAKDMDKPLPGKPIVITFDDGYLDNYTLMYPILQEHGVKATVFVVGRHLDEEYFNFFTWEQARTMLASGLVDIQSHTYDLHRDPFLDRAAGTSEAEHSAVILGDADRLDAVFMRELGYIPTVIAYPHGRHDRHTLAAYRDRYAFGFTVNHGVAYLRNDSLTLPRIRMTEETVIRSDWR